MDAGIGFEARAGEVLERGFLVMKGLGGVEGGGKLVEGEGVHVVGVRLVGFQSFWGFTRKNCHHSAVCHTTDVCERFDRY